MLIYVMWVCVSVRTVLIHFKHRIEKLLPHSWFINILDLKNPNCIHYGCYDLFETKIVSFFRACFTITYVMSI